jgi:hypothetical protein
MLGALYGHPLSAEGAENTENQAFSISAISGSKLPPPSLFQRGAREDLMGGRNRSEGDTDHSEPRCPIMISTLMPYSSNDHLIGGNET